MRQVWLLAAVPTIAMTLAEPAAQAQFARLEAIAIKTSNASEAEVLTGTKASETWVACHLRLAKAAPKQPVVVLMHGIGGIGTENGAPGTWARLLNDAGISTCTLDSHTSRGIYSLPEAQKLPNLLRMLDLFAAREALTKHPFLDADRIAVMGFSGGSIAAIYSNLERFQNMYGSGKFAAHISVYGLCGTKYHQDDKTVSPLIFLHGIADDWVPIGPCREYASRLKAAGRDVRMFEYADSYHVFDGPSAGPLRKASGVATFASCRFEETDKGVVVNVETRLPLTRQDGCWRPDPSLGHNEAAMKKAHDDVLAALKGIFKM